MRFSAAGRPVRSPRVSLPACAIYPAQLVTPVEANLVFLDLPEHAIEALAARGFLFLRRSVRMIRLVCRFDGIEEEVDLLLDALRRSLETRVAAAG